MRHTKKLGMAVVVFVTALATLLILRPKPDAANDAATPSSQSLRSDAVETPSTSDPLDYDAPRQQGRAIATGVPLRVGVECGAALAPFVEKCEIVVTAESENGDPLVERLNVPVNVAVERAIPSAFSGLELLCTIEGTVRYAGQQRRLSVREHGGWDEFRAELQPYPSAGGLVLEIDGSPATVTSIAFPEAGVSAHVERDGRFTLGPLGAPRGGVGRLLGNARVEPSQRLVVHVAEPELVRADRWSDVIVITAEPANLTVIRSSLARESGSLRVETYARGQQWLGDAPSAIRSRVTGTWLSSVPPLVWEPIEDGGKAVFPRVPADIALQVVSDRPEGVQRFVYVESGGALLTEASATSQRLILAPGDDVEVRIVGNRRLSGTVRHQTGEVAVGARVAIAWSPSHTDLVSTDGQGTYDYEMPGQMPTETMIAIVALANATSARGPSPMDRTARLDFSSEIVELAVNSKQDEYVVDLQLSEALYITGRAIRENGLPVAHAFVSASTTGAREGDSGLMRSAHWMTDANGRFRVGALAPGAYTVSIWPSLSGGFGAIGTAVNVQAGADVGDLLCSNESAIEVNVRLRDSAQGATTGQMWIVPDVVLPVREDVDHLKMLRGSNLPLSPLQTPIAHLGNGVMAAPVALQRYDDGSWVAHSLKFFPGTYRVLLLRRDAQGRTLPPRLMGPFEVRSGLSAIEADVPPHCTVTVTVPTRPATLTAVREDGDIVAFSLGDGSINDAVTVSAQPLQIFLPVAGPVNLVIREGNRTTVVATIPAGANEAVAAW